MADCAFLSVPTSRLHGNRIWADNPVQGRIVVHGTKTGGRLMLFDLSGKEIRGAHSSDSFTILDITGLPQGMYVVRYWNDECIEGLRVVKVE
jgi:hypothetical protein